MCYSNYSNPILLLLMPQSSHQQLATSQRLTRGLTGSNVAVPMVPQTTPFLPTNFYFQNNRPLPLPTNQIHDLLGTLYARMNHQAARLLTYVYVIIKFEPIQLLSF